MSTSGSEYFPSSQNIDDSEKVIDGDDLLEDCDEQDHEESKDTNSEDHFASGQLLFHVDQNYNSSSDANYVESDLSSSEGSDHDVDLDSDEVEDELCFLEGKNYFEAATMKISKIVGSFNNLKKNQRDLAKLWEAMYDQNEKLLKVNNELLQELKKSPASASHLPNNGRGKAKMPVDCSVS